MPSSNNMVELQILLRGDDPGNLYVFCRFFKILILCFKKTIKIYEFKIEIFIINFLFS